MNRTHKDFKIAVDKWKTQSEELAAHLNKPIADQQTVRGLMKAHNNERHFMLVEGLNAIKQGKHGPTWAKSLLQLLEYPESIRAHCEGKRCEGRCVGYSKCCNPVCRRCCDETTV